jgi:hypothetical protein
MQFTIDAAKNNFSKLIDLARAGEEVEIVAGEYADREDRSDAAAEIHNRAAEGQGRRWRT